jgi:putative ABC transport system permease protein
MGERLSILLHRLKALLGRARLDRDLEDELRFHIEMRQQKTGLDPLAARRRFGNVSSFKEVCREMWTLGSIEILWQDVRYALRTLRKSPVFTGVAVFALALGIGANTAIFSVVNAVVLKPLPYRDPGRLVLLWGNVRRMKVERRGTSYPDFADWRSQSKSFDGMAVYNPVGSTLTGGDEPERVKCEQVSAAYFSILGVTPILGRTFLPSEDQVPMRDQVVILSEGLWKRRFGADASVIGKTLRTASGRNLNVVGVVPASFGGISDSVDMWVPYMLSGSAGNLAERGDRGIAVLARLKPGVSLAQAQAELDVVCQRLAREYPGTNEARGVEVAPLDTELLGDIRPAVLALLGAVAFVLLIACANVANLLLARSEARQREIALRVALGAGRLRLWRQLITESCVLATIGAGAGLLLALFGVRILMATSPVTFPTFVHPGIDPPVALFTLLVSLLCGIVMGFAPAIHSRIARLHTTLKEGSGRVAGGKMPQRFRDGLVVVEIALTLVLLIGAGLLIRSFRELNGLNPGFDPQHLLCLTAGLPRIPPRQTEPPAADEPSVAHLDLSTRQILDRVRALPSVASAAIATDLPLSGIENAVLYTAEGQPAVTAQNIPRAYYHRVTPEFFQVLRTPLIAGRSFSPEEINGNAPVVIVSENVRKRFWPGRDPIGKRIKTGGPASHNSWLRVIGVVGEMKYRGLPNNPTADPDIYGPWSDEERDILLVIRTALDPAGLAPAVRNAIHEIDKTIPIYDVATMTEQIGAQTARNRFTSWLMGIFAAVALLLAMVGVYGVMSYSVTRRTQEIGVRMALGANRPQVLLLIVGQGLPLILAGIVAGLAVSFALTRLIATLLYGVTPTDAFTFTTVTALLVSIALFACWMPAVRASRVDPLVALRHE